MCLRSTPHQSECRRAKTDVQLVSILVHAHILDLLDTTANLISNILKSLTLPKDRTRVFVARASASSASRGGKSRPKITDGRREAGDECRAEMSSKLLTIILCAHRSRPFLIGSGRRATVSSEARLCFLNEMARGVISSGIENDQPRTWIRCRMDRAAISGRRA